MQTGVAAEVHQRGLQPGVRHLRLPAPQLRVAGGQQARWEAAVAHQGPLRGGFIVEKISDKKACEQCQKTLIPEVCRSIT